MEKHIFEHYFNSLVDQLEYDEKFGETLGSLFETAYSGNLLYNHGHFVDRYIELLEMCFGDDNSTISWYVFDTGMKGGKIVDNGVEYNIDSLDKLYEYLMNEKREKTIN